MDQFLSLTDAQERVKFPDEAPAEPQKPDGSLRVLAITARPTGITHTYMAAGALEKKGRDLDTGVKAETQGSGGAKNTLTGRRSPPAIPLRAIPSCIVGSAGGGGPVHGLWLRLSRAPGRAVRVPRHAHRGHPDRLRGRYAHAGLAEKEEGVI